MSVEIVACSDQLVVIRARTDVGVRSTHCATPRRVRRDAAMIS